MYETFQPGAIHFEVTNQPFSVLQFQVSGFPGPSPVSDEVYQWAHCYDQLGAVGILTCGRVLRSCRDTLGLRPTDPQCISFFGRVHTNPCDLDDFRTWLGRLPYSAKNSSGVIFSGQIAGQHFRSPRADTWHETQLCRQYPLVHSPARDKRWCIRECAARIETIFVLVPNE